MAGLQINPTDIAKARESGYSDQEIATFLSAKAPEQFKQAREAGYSDKEILSHLSGDDNKPSGALAGAGQGLAGVVHGVAETGKQFLGMDTSGADKTAQAIAPTNYKSAQVVPEGGHWYDPRTYNYSQIPQAIAEAAPGMATDIAAAKIGSKVAGPVGGVVGGVGSYLLRTRGDAAKNDAAVRTGNPDAPVETQDKVRSLATGALESVPAVIGLNRFLPGGKLPTSAASALAKLGITAATEAGTGAAQNAISQAGATVGTPGGLKVDPAQVVDAGITSGAAGGALAVPKGMAEASAARKYAPLGGDNEAATKAFTGRVNTALDGDKITTERSYTALRDAEAANRNELKTAMKPLKGTLDDDTEAALNKAKKGYALTDTELSNIAENTTPDVAFLARQAHVANLIKGLGDYSNGEFIGGIANSVGKHVRAIQNPQGAAVSAALGAASLGGHAASLFAYGPATLAAIAGGYAGMRGIDALTGNRTPLKGVMDRFTDPNAPVRLPAPEPPEAPAPASTGPTGPKVPFNPGVAGGGTALALGQNPFAPKAPAPQADPQINPLALPKDVTGPAKTLFSAIQKVRDMQAAQNPEAPAPASPINPLSLPKDVTGPAKTLADGYANVAKMRDTAVGNRAVDRIASESPMVDEVGGLNAIRNPAVGKRAGQLVSTARALQQLMRQPEEEGAPGPAPAPGPAAPPLAPVAPGAPAPGPALAPAAGPAPAGPPKSIADILARLNAAKAAPAEPVAPVPAMQGGIAARALEKMAAAKITKTDGKVHEEPAAAPADEPYKPLEGDALWRKGLPDAQVADQELSKYEPEVRKKYAKNVIANRVAKRDIMESLANDAAPGDDRMMGDLYHQLDHISRRNVAIKAVEHYTAHMTPQGAQAVKAALGPMMDKLWKKQ